MKIAIFSPSGVILEPQRLRLAEKELEVLGWQVHIDEDARQRFLRFAGTDEIRLAATHRVAQGDADVIMASRGGYGLSRLLDRLDWDLIAQSVFQGKQWVGHSDFTALSLGLLAHTGAPSWAGPMALADFGRIDAPAVTVDGVNRLMSETFLQCMQGALAGVQFQADQNYGDMQVSGVLWGSNLSMLCSMIGTPHFPNIKEGILFLEDVNERPYCVERMLLQLHQSGILARQKAVILGDFGPWHTGVADQGYRFKDVIAYLESIYDGLVITGLPFGHVEKKLTLPIGVVVDVTVQDQLVDISWGQAGFQRAVEQAALEAEHRQSQLSQNNVAMSQNMRQRPKENR